MPDLEEYVVNQVLRLIVFFIEQLIRAYRKSN